MKNYSKLLAHYDKENPLKKQFLMDHLFEVSRISKNIGSTVRLKSTCELLGILHDFGKYRHEFQIYIKGEYRGMVNHISAGARLLDYIEDKVKNKHRDEVDTKEKVLKLYKEILQYPILSHHGLYDIIDKNCNYHTKIRLNYNNDSTEMEKDLEFFNFLNSEYKRANNTTIYDLYYEGFIEFEQVYIKLKEMARKFNVKTDKDKEKIHRKKALYFYYGSLIRLLLSILKEADIYDSSNYYRTDKDRVYSVEDKIIIWGQMSESVESLYAKFEDKEIYYREFSDIIDEILNKVIKDGKCLELNTRRLDNDISIKNIIDIYKRFNELGGKYITLGSDAHQVEAIGNNFMVAREISQLCNLKIVYFKNRLMEYDKGF